MSTVAVASARPVQNLRQRRESHRPSHSKSASRNINLENGNDTKKANMVVPFVKDTDYILKTYSGCPPSLVVHLYASHLRIEPNPERLPYEPWSTFIQHIRNAEVPHDMLEELHARRTPFYEGCLIVQVHDHKSKSAGKPADAVKNEANGTKHFSIHTRTQFTTPSPYVPYSDNKSTGQGTQGAASAKGGDEAINGGKTAGEAMPAPSMKDSNEAKILTLVLFPTLLSQEEDFRLLSVNDVSSSRKLTSNGRLASTPTMPHPSTPGGSVPPTPTGRAPGRGSKFPLDQIAAYELQAQMIFATAPPLDLEPTKTFEESLALIERHTHPNNMRSPPSPRKRKRTTAEVAADEADAAAQKTYIMIGDDRKVTANVGAADDGDAIVGTRGGGYAPAFARFKTLENIRAVQEDNDRRKKEEEARVAQARKEQQEKQKMQEAAEAQSRTNEQQRMMQLQAAATQRRTQQQQNAQAQAVMASIVPGQGSQQQPQFNGVQGQQSSPIVRQQTPMASSPNATSTTHAVPAPMAATTSSMGAASPPRPLSAVSHHPAANTPNMARQASQQQIQQVPSRNNTPQLPQGTPNMSPAMPNNRMTPQPRPNQQGSPMGSVPMMGNVSQQMANPQLPNLTPEQQAQLRAVRHAQFIRQQQQQHMQGSQQPPMNNQEIQQRIAMMQQAAGQQGNSNQRQQYAQALQQMQANNSPNPHAMANGMGMRQNINPNPAQMMAQFEAYRKRAQQQYPNGNYPPQVMQQLQQGTAQVRAIQHRAQQQALVQQNMGNNAGAMQNMQAMNGMPQMGGAGGGGGGGNNMQGQGQGNQDPMAQYQQLLRHQAQANHQNQLMMQARRQQQQGMGNMNMNGMNMNQMGGMNPNQMAQMGNMTPQQMQMFMQQQQIQQMRQNQGH